MRCLRWLWGVEAGVPLADGAAALGALAPGDKRGEVLRLRGAQIINDCYNSNPSALHAMIATLASVPAERRILVAGEMLELGAESRALHAECGEAAARAGLDWVVGVRGDAEALVQAAANAGGASEVFSNAARGWSVARQGDEGRRCGVAEGLARGASGAGADGLAAVAGSGVTVGVKQKDGSGHSWFPRVRIDAWGTPFCS